jgi:hypothetical protein
MQFVKGKPPETQYAIRPGARLKRRGVALGRLGFEPGCIRAWLSLRPSQGGMLPLTAELRLRQQKMKLRVGCDCSIGYRSPSKQDHNKRKNQVPTSEPGCRSEHMQRVRVDSDYQLLKQRFR